MIAGRARHTLVSNDTRCDDRFPVPSLPSPSLLQPIRSWEEMYREVLVTGVEFDAFWYESVSEGAACFFRWMGEPRATVLVVLGPDELSHIECRRRGDVELSPAESLPIILEVTQLFRAVGPGSEPRGPYH